MRPEQPDHTRVHALTRRKLREAGQQFLRLLDSLIEFLSQGYEFPKLFQQLRLQRLIVPSDQQKQFEQLPGHQRCFAGHLEQLHRRVELLIHLFEHVWVVRRSLPGRTTLADTLQQRVWQPIRPWIALPVGVGLRLG